MTNYDFDCIIDLHNMEILCKTKNKEEVGSLRIVGCSQSLQFNSHKKGRKEKVNLVEKTVNLKDTAGFMIDLFKLTKSKYSCSQTKLGKLLSIVAFRMARLDIKIFEEDIKKSNCCGTVIKELNKFYDTSVYDGFLYLDNENTLDEIMKPELIVVDKSLIKDIGLNIDNTLRDIIISAFEVFSSYDAFYLGQKISEFFEKANLLNDEETIELDKIKTINKEIYKDSNCMEIVNFVLG